MTKQERVADAIKRIIESMMNRVMDNVLVKDPFIEEEHHAKKPLYSALVPDEIFKWSHFERRFVTPFWKVWEQLALVVWKEAHGESKMWHTVQWKIWKERLRRIQEVLDRLEHSEKWEKKISPNWDEELSYILEWSGDPIPVSVVCDIYIENIETWKKYAFELKAPLPNSDQTKVSKEKIFKLMAMNPKIIDEAYYALPYNPYWKKEDYAWTFPMRWFDMRLDRVVLIGNEFWDKIWWIGTYHNFINEVNKLWKNYKERIYREFLRIEPPVSDSDSTLK